MIPASLPKPLRRWNAGAAVFAALLVAACTCTTGDGFRITKPTAGEHLPPGDVVVCVTPVPGDYCYFPPKAYEVTLDGGQEVTASITKESVRELGLEVGSPVTAVIKSTEVMLGAE